MRMRTFKIVCFGAVLLVLLIEIIDARAVTGLDYKNPICFQINWLGSVLQRSFDVPSHSNLKPAIHLLKNQACIYSNLIGYTKNLLDDQIL